MASALASHLYLVCYLTFSHHSRIPFKPKTYDHCDPIESLTAGHNVDVYYSHCLPKAGLYILYLIIEHPLQQPSLAFEYMKTDVDVQHDIVVDWSDLIPENEKGV